MAVTGVSITGIHKIDKIDICHRFNLLVLRVASVIIFSMYYVICDVFFFRSWIDSWPKIFIFLDFCYRDMIATGCEDKCVRVFYVAASTDLPLKVFSGKQQFW